MSLEGAYKRAMQQLLEDFDKKEKDMKFQIELQAEDNDNLLRAKRDLERQVRELKAEREELNRGMGKVNSDLEYMKKIQRDEIRTLLINKANEMV